MRFAAVPLPKTEPTRSPAAEFVRKLLGGEKALLPQQAPALGEPPPADLDQRVRLVGEW
ncbi:hypothetical protein [Ramlibacter sp. PS4R-6]|uniref:hypothetical protein n=1 Tax=Ramlibacter sp. PS4R-6 TaxID=3133438 RepID=UPI0030AA2B70